jgi:hypothetical protein
VRVDSRTELMIQEEDLSLSGERRTFPEVVEEADIVLATLGASTALAGFTLVFLGVVITRYEETLPGASRRVRGQFATPAGGLLAVFVLSLLTVAISFAWLVARGGHGFYLVIVTLFFVQLLSTALASGYVTWDVLLKK